MRLQAPLAGSLLISKQVSEAALNSAADIVVNNDTIYLIRPTRKLTFPFYLTSNQQCQTKPSQPLPTVRVARQMLLCSSRKRNLTRPVWLPLTWAVFDHEAQLMNACSFRICDINPCWSSAEALLQLLFPLLACRIQHASFTVARLELSQSYCAFDTCSRGQVALIARSLFSLLHSPFSMAQHHFGQFEYALMPALANKWLTLLAVLYPYSYASSP